MKYRIGTILAMALMLMNSCREETQEEILASSIQENTPIAMGLDENAMSENQIAKLNISHKNWMSKMDEYTFLKDITLIGSHDAGAYKKGGSLAKTQSDDIKTQLESGVRYLDIRLNYMEKTKSLTVYHGIVSQDLDFTKDVLEVVAKFLKENPTEMVFMVVKNESGNNMAEWKKKINQDFAKFSSILLKSYHTDTFLGDVRGKIAVISRAGQLDYGKPLSGQGHNTVAVGILGKEKVYFSDKYSVGSILPKDINAKANVVFDGIYNAQQEKNKNHWFIINANGASPLAHPIHVANRINPMLSEYLAKHIYQPYKAQVPHNFIAMRSGFIVIDFATSTEGKKIINLAIHQSLTANSSELKQRHNKTPGYIQ